MMTNYDVIVVGAGHAGCEAAAAAARLGSKVLLITMNMQTMGQMSCNPAMGGIAKGQIVREIDALGGLSGIITDRTTIQFRMLNRSKGPAMWSPRSQNDRWRFSEEWRLALEQIENIDFYQDTADRITVRNGKVTGIITAMGVAFGARAVVLTNGTFLNGLIHIGEKNLSGGRAGEKAARGMTACLLEHGFISGRMKTGTPPRLDSRTINYRVMEEQKGDEQPGKFSFSQQTRPVENQLSCFITYTNSEVHEILKEGFDRSPMFSGRIEGIGPRYCPSIEDKINRFADRERHQLFVEPEGRQTVEVYLNGFSSSLPIDVQLKALHKIKGLEQARIFRPGYAIEYDYFPPEQLKHSLETKLIEHLYFAGQINGTTGYEEAGCQGLMAGINAHLKLHDKEPLILRRSEAYIGVLIDDLITKSTEEPYRMFTSRAEHRSLLRQDNADIRLTAKGYTTGLVSESQYWQVLKKQEQAAGLEYFLRKSSLHPDKANPMLVSRETEPVAVKTKLYSLLLRPQVSIADLAEVSEELKAYIAANRISEDSINEAAISVKYQSYIEKEKEFVERMNRFEEVYLKPDFDYYALPSLSLEARQKLAAVKPISIGQASRISGVSPADISVLLVYVGK
ncbi:MAG: tRNA uridine-5-carboxymethylaminomethyl(34) synthesis enzyme MnmG [Bacteroidia bacterium]|nr:tRNA uridine-5-carboxymethylaminomethyl(34) synthesis enzyme MnmG [Bacteroidia bacterium]MCZ2278354.1 tRNA uridine-5-carboxymethylaminomethyl(34) synthesis enzyme MnmG [Bacteroidia bacterium]